MPQPAAQPTDVEAAELVARMRAGDASAFRDLFRLWFPDLVSLAYHYLGSSDAAEDVAQEAFVELWSSRVDWKWEGSALGYLQLIVRRKSLKILRREAIEARHGERFGAEGHSPTSGVIALAGDESLIQREFWASIATAIQSLPPRTRAVAILRWFEGLSRTEAAAELEISVRTVDAQTISAAKGIRKWLQSNKSHGD